MALVVTKFGGTSVGSTERIMAVAARLIERHKAGDGVVAVVSAMGDVTDELVGLAEEIIGVPSRARDGHAAGHRRAGHDRAARHGDPCPRT